MGNRLGYVAAVAAMLVLGLSHNEARAQELTEAHVKRVMSSHYPEVRSCYLRHADTQKTAQGNVVVKLVVAKDGRVKAGTQSVEAPGVRGKAFEQCVKRATEDWRFPMISNPTEVSLPLLFLKTRARGAGPQFGKAAR